MPFGKQQRTATFIATVTVLESGEAVYTHTTIAVLLKIDISITIIIPALYQLVASSATSRYHLISKFAAIQTDFVFLDGKHSL